MIMHRRTLLQTGLALGSLSALAGCATLTSKAPAKAQVVVIGGGYGGATAAKYVRMLSNYQISVVLIEPNTTFISCPMSNLVVGGSKNMAQITMPFDGLRRQHGITLVHDRVASIDTQKKTVSLPNGTTIGYDKLVVSPGVDMSFDSIEGLQAANASGQILQAWKAGAETTALRKQLEAMPDGGVYAITVPEAPYKCPPGPYERASQVAHYFKQAKPKSKVLILDANPDVTSKAALFKKYWSDNYKDIVEFRPNHKVTAVDAKNSRPVCAPMCSMCCPPCALVPLRSKQVWPQSTTVGAASTTRPSSHSLPKTCMCWGMRFWLHPPCPSQVTWPIHMPKWPLQRWWRNSLIWRSIPRLYSPTPATAM
jgi:hypothetical protein